MLNSSTMRVLIAGCGYVGSILGRRLVEEGHEVWGLSRHPRELGHPEVHPVAADLTGPDLAERLPRVDRVVYAASADASEPEAYRRAYVDGVKNLQSGLAARQILVDRFVFVSSTATYGDAKGDWVDEETLVQPEHFRGRIVLDGESEARRGVTRSVVVRLGGIYGPGRTRLLDRVRSGDASAPEVPPMWSNRIHRDDAAGVLHHILMLPDPADLYLGVDDEPASLLEVYRYVAGLLGTPEPRVTPDGGGSRPNKRCSNRRLRESGYRFRYPTYRDGYGAMVRSDPLDG